MIEDTDNIADLLGDGAAKLLTAKVGPPETILQGLHIEDGLLVIKDGAALPVVGGKTSLKAFGEVRRNKYAKVLNVPLAPTKQLESGVYVHGAFNYYHFLAFHFSSLLFLQSISGGPPPCIFTTNWAPSNVAEFLRRSLPRFTGGRRVEVSRLTDGTYSLRNVVVPLKPSPAATVYTVREILLPQIVASVPADSIKLFVRRESKSRRLSNQDEIEHWLTERGYVAVDPGQLSFEDQALTFHGASHIVGVEGAGMANILFATNAARVVVLQSPAVGRENFFGVFRKYYGFAFDKVSGTISNRAEIVRDSDFTVAISDLERLTNL